MITLISTLILGRAAVAVIGRITHSGKPVADAVVWLEGPTHPKAGKGIVNQRHQAFEPHIQVLPIHSKIEFPNNDDVFHNVYAEFQAKRFDLGVYPKGQSRSVIFDKVGIVSVLCNVHSQMSAYIVIVDTPYYAKTDRQGNFKISGVPEWGYTLHVWHESGRSAIKKLPSVSSQESLKIVL